MSYASKMEEDMWECLEKPIPIEFDCPEDEDSNNSTNRSDSTDSPPRKRRKFRRLLDFQTAEQLEELKFVAVEVIELKDYAEWFIKSRSKTNVNDILFPSNYCGWASKLAGTEAEAKVMIHPFNYCTWYQNFVVDGTVPPRRREMEYLIEQDRRYGELALAHFNNNSNNCGEDYEYTGQCDLFKCEEFVHLNFYARLKVSQSRPEPGPFEVFFAEVLPQNKVTLCCILDSDSKEFGDTAVRHPSGFKCLKCVNDDEDDDVCYFGCECDDE